MELEQHLNTAAREYLARKSGRAKPKGFMADGYWQPTDNECCPLCSQVISPNLGGDKWAFWSHCKGAAHVAAKYGVSEKELRKAAKAL